MARIHGRTSSIVDLGGGSETRVRIELGRSAGRSRLEERLGVTLIDPVDELKHVIQGAILVSEKGQRRLGEPEREGHHGAGEFGIDFLVVLEAIVTIVEFANAVDVVKRGGVVGEPHQSEHVTLARPGG